MSSLRNLLILNAKHRLFNSLDTTVVHRQGSRICCRKYCAIQDESELEQNYKDVMTNVPIPVVIVSTAHKEQDSLDTLKRGLTCGSFTSISLRPRIISFAVNKPSRFHNLLLKTSHFAVHVLTKKQVGLATHFAQPAVDGVDQFQDIEHTVDDHGLPVIQNTLAVLKCQRHSVATIGDHYMWYGEVLEAVAGDTRNAPMLYYLRSYRSVGDETFMQAFEKQTLPVDQWTHRAHLQMAWNYIKEYGKDQAIPHIREGIQRYNEKNKDKISRGYSETVTHFYAHMLDLAMSRSEYATFEEFLQDNEDLMSWDLLFRYYSKSVLKNPESQSRFIPPDLQQLP